MPRSSCENRSRPSFNTLFEAIRAGRAGGDPVPANLARLDHSIDRRAGIGSSVPSPCSICSAFPLTRSRCSAWWLAIGIVVDDAIVVVENVERNIEEGRTPLEAAPPGDGRSIRADRRDSRSCCVRCSCRWAFLTGVTGTFYKQFAGDDRDLDRDLGDQFADLVAGARRQNCCIRTTAPEGYAFAPDRTPARLVSSGRSNRFFKASSDSYQGRRFSRTLGRRGGVVFMVYVVLLAGTGLMFSAVPAWLHSDPGQALSDRRREAARGILAGSAPMPCCKG